MHIFLENVDFMKVVKLAKTNKQDKTNMKMGMQNRHVNLSFDI